MALSKLSGDEQCIIFSQLCNTLDARVAVGYGSASSELWALTQAQRQQLRADHEVAEALSRKAAGMRSCKELRVATRVVWMNAGLIAADLATLGTLGSVLPALEALTLVESGWAAGPDGVQRLAEGLGAGALPAVTFLYLYLPVGDAGASALAAALGRGALPQLKFLNLNHTAIGDVGLVALAPALRRLPALEDLNLNYNPFGDEGLAALVAPPPAVGAPPPSTGVLTKLEQLHLNWTQVNDAGCAALAAALGSSKGSWSSRALPAFKHLFLGSTPASAAAQEAVQAAVMRRWKR